VTEANRRIGPMYVWEVTVDFFEVVARRYSHKAALDPESPPSDAELRRMVEAGMAAPSAMNRQSPEFVIVNDQDTLQRIGEITGNAVLRTAPAVIFVIANPSASEECYREDYAAATENVILAATALGYACGWLDAVFRNEGIRGAVSALLGIPDDRLLAVAVPVGRPAEESPRRSKKPFEERASWNRYTVRRS